MIEKLIEKLNISVTKLDAEYITTENGKRAQGAFRWNYFANQAEIVLSNTATEKTMLHEIGHAINFILGKGYPISETIEVDSEEFANNIANALKKCYSKNAKGDS
jgi:hypothetical protein